jgi:hypothetical protein
VENVVTIIGGSWHISTVPNQVKECIVATSTAKSNVTRRLAISVPSIDINAYIEELSSLVL